MFNSVIVDIVMETIATPWRYCNDDFPLVHHHFHLETLEVLEHIMFVTYDSW